jgi:hypothetical protein
MVILQPGGGFRALIAANSADDLALVTPQHALADLVEVVPSRATLLADSC